MQYASHSEIEPSELDEMNWEGELELKPVESEAGQVGSRGSPSARATRPGARSQRTLKARLFESVLRPALRGLCLVTCCIGCPNDPMFKTHDLQKAKSVEDTEMVLRIINAEDQNEPETDEDWEALSETSLESWTVEKPDQVVTPKKTEKVDNPFEAEVKVTYYDDETKDERPSRSCESLCVLDRPLRRLIPQESPACNTKCENLTELNLTPESPNPFCALEFIEEPRSISPWEKRKQQTSNDRNNKETVSADDMLSREWDS